MKNLSLLVTFLVATALSLQAQTLGTYPATTIATAGGNAIVTPAVAPTGTTNVVASTAAGFKGVLQVNPSTGKLTITNAYPAGTYTITIKAFTGTATATTSFLLTVGNSLCANFGAVSGTIALTETSYSLALGDFNNDGRQDIAVVQDYSGTVLIRLNNGSGGFTGTTSLSVGQYPRAITVSDLNGDGNQDLVVVSKGYNVATAWLGNGTGSFTQTSSTSAAANPTGLALGDFNGDGKTDMAVASSAGNAVSLRMGDGAGGFSGSSGFTVASASLVATADVNKDGKTDLIVTGYGQAFVFTGNGAGSFTQVAAVSCGYGSGGLQVADFNQDGNEDFAVSETSSSPSGSNVYVFLGNGAGGFTAAPVVLVDARPGAMAVADCNGDGRPDITTLNYSTYSIRYGDGTGRFTGSASRTVNLDVSAGMVIGDFNGDGKPDMAYIGYGSGNYQVAVLPGSNNEINVLGNGISIASGSNAPSAANHTTYENNTVRTYTIQNTGAASLAVSTIRTAAGPDSAAFVVGGITLPIIVAAGSSTTFTVSFMPTSTGIKNTTLNIGNDDCDEATYTFAVQGLATGPDVGAYPASTTLAWGSNTTLAPATPPTNTVSITAVGSPNFKGQLQVSPATGVVTVTNAQPAGSHTITVKAYNATGFFARTFTLQVGTVACSQALFVGTTAIPGGTTVRSMATADINNDGNLDLLAANAGTSTSTVLVRLGDGAGGFTAGTDVPVGGGTQPIVVADFNRDGNPDFVTTNINSNTVSIRLGNGTGTFTAAADVISGNGPQGVAVGDVNGDGFSDLVICNYNVGTVVVRLGNGAGGFTNGTTLTGLTAPRSIALADLNGDGKLDMIVNNFTLSYATVWLGNGAGGFTRVNDIPLGYSSSNQVDAITISDLNGDGLADYSFFYKYDPYSGWILKNGLGTGDGNFTGNGTLGLTSSVQSTPGGMVSGDFNGDGITDLLLCNNNTSTTTDNSFATIGIGTGNGNVNISKVLGVGASSAIVAGDFNKDGLTDFAAANLSGTIAIRLGSANQISLYGNAALIPAGDSLPSFNDSTDFGNVDTAASHTYTIRNSSLVDLTIDSIGLKGLNPTAFAINGITLPVTVASGGSVSFTVRFLPSATGVQKAAVLIYNNNCTNRIYAFTITGTALLPTISFSYPASAISTGKNGKVFPVVAPTNAATISATAPARFKGVLQVNPATGVVSITNAYPAGTYTIRVRAYAFSTSFILTVADPGCSRGRFATIANDTLKATAAIAAGDFNGDGNQDLAVAATGTTSPIYSVIIRLGNGAGGFTTAATLPASGVATTLLVSDFNRDGKQDLAIGYTGGVVSIRLGNGAGGFTAAPDILLGLGANFFLATADFNGDGKMDLVAANSTRNLAAVRLGDGTGGFTSAADVALGDSPYSIATDDFNGDGNTDFAATNFNSNTVSVRLGDGTGAFISAPDVVVGTRPRWITLSDFNKDGNTDMAVACVDGNTVSTRLGTGMGTFTGTGQTAIGTSVYRIASGDFNGDGNPDFVTAHTNTTAPAFVGLGNGLGGFTLSSIVASGSHEYLAIGDFNGDGRQDLAFTNTTAGAVSFRLNTDKEITVLGNNNNITTGSTGPDTANYTSMGAVAIGATLTRTFTIQNTGSDTLQVTGINITGADSARFAVSGITFPAYLPAGTSRTFTVSFSPMDGGVAKATISVLNDDCDESVFSFAVQGRGLCTTSSTLNVWLGASANWSEPANWSLGFVPNGCTPVVVNAGVAYMPEVTGTTATCYRLTLNNGATVLVRTGSKLNITGE